MKKLKSSCREASVSVTISALLILVIGSFSVYASKTLAPGWNSLGGNQAEQFTVTATPSDAADISVTFTLPGFSSAKARLDNRDWTSVTFTGQCNTDNIGAPNLPLMRRFFAVPPNATVTVEVVDVAYEAFTNSAIDPFQRPLLETETAAERTFTINEKLYATNTFYPEKWSAAVQPVIMHGVHLGILEINPFRFNPVTKELQVASRITCKITYTKPQNGKALTFPSNLENTLKALLINYNFMEYTMVPYQAKLKGSKATDYLFIVDEDLMNAASFEELVALHGALGLNTEVKSSAGLSSATAVMDVIETAYNAGELDYVMLIGDLPAIPHNTDVSSPSDSWYSWLEGGDKVGDIGIGRFPATDETKLNYMVRKNIDFQLGLEQGEWRKKSVLIAHQENYPDKYTACKETIYDKSYQLEKPVMDRLYGGEDATNADVTDAINEGRIVVNYRGHGSRTSWSGWNGSSYSTSTISALSNGKKTPIVFSMACTNGDMSSSSDCLAEAFMCQEQGAVAIVAATEPSMTTVNHTYDKALYAGAWDEGIGAFGDLRNYADAEALEEHGSSANNNVTMYVLFADPTVNIHETVSLEPFIKVYSPNGGERWEVGTTHDLKWGDNIDGNVKIELFKGGSLKEELAASVASTGTFEWQIAGDYETGDDYTVKVTSIDSSALLDESDSNFSIVPEYIIVCPYFQNFDTLEAESENLPFKYEQLTDDDLNWTVYSGPTPSKVGSSPDQTGPDGDHTTGDDNYMYVEASSSNNPDKTADFVTAKFNFKELGDPELSFWYHMFSAEDAMGDLYLDINVDGTWHTDVVHLTDDNGDQWNIQEVDLNPYKGDRVIFKFRGITGSSWCSDICIDDFKIDGTVPITNTVAKIPASFDLKYNGSRIYFQVPNNSNSMSRVTLKLYNLQGKLVSTLVKGNVKAGYHFISLDKMSHTGQKMAAGMYLCRMETKDFTKTINILFRK